MTAAQTRSPGRSKVLIFYAVTIALFLGLAELGLALVDPEQIMVREDDPRMVYSFYPERTGVSTTPEYRVEVTTDGEGMRSCQAARPDSAPARQVLVLGDSFAEGWGVPCEKTFAGLLNRTPGAALQVHNGGLHGGSPGYYILRYRVLKKMNPDVLVVQIFDNDLDDLDKFAPFVVRDASGRLVAGRAAGLGPIPPGALSRFLKNRGLYRAIKRIYYGIRRRPLPIKYYRPGRAPDEPILSHAAAVEKFGPLAALEDPEVDYGGQFAFYKFRSRDEMLADSVWGSRYKRMHGNLVQLFTEARAEDPNRRLILIYIPAREVFAPGGILGRGPNRPLTVAELRAGNLFYGLLRQLADENEVGLIDGQEIFHGDAEDLYFPGDAHLNVKGHARLAEAIAAALTRN